MLAEVGRIRARFCVVFACEARESELTWRAIAEFKWRRWLNATKGWLPRPPVDNREARAGAVATWAGVRPASGALRYVCRFRHCRVPIPKPAQV